MEFNNQYLKYDEYLSLKGELERMPFNLLEFEARKRIDKHTFGRLKNLEEQVDEVKLCVNALINEISIYKSKGNIVSESADGYSISYDQPLTVEQENKLYSLIKTYLSDCKLVDGTPYLFRGV